MTAEYLRAAEIALLTGMSVRSIRRWIRNGVLPSNKLGGARLVAVTDLKAALSAFHGTQEAANDGEEYDAESQV